MKMAMSRGCRRCGCILAALPFALAADAAQPSHVATAVEQQLALDRLAELDDIDATVKGERVTLHGTVPTLMAKERATRIARTIEGVQDVANEIVVQPRKVLSADELDAVVRTALLTAPGTQSNRVHVLTEPGGLVSLSGTVESWAKRDAAEQVAKSISGVTAVRNSIEVDYATSRPDREVAADIERLLRWDAYLGDNNIDVSVHGGDVSLRGTVDNSAEKSHASRLAWIAGTKSVDVEGLKISTDSAATVARKQREAGTSDQDIAEAVRSRLALSAAVSNPVEVDVVRGVATLRGEVETLEAARNAAALASQVAGVESINDHLQIASAGGVTSDSQLETSIATALGRNPLTDAYEIEVDVNDGVVDLVGNVGSWIEKGAAEDLVAGMHGVRAINNRLQVLDYARARRAH